MTHCGVGYSEVESPFPVALTRKKLHGPVMATDARALRPRWWFRRLALCCPSASPPLPSRKVPKRTLRGFRSSR